MNSSGFDRIASVYDLLARLVFGNSIVHSQKHFLTKIPSDAKVLILGGGTGWILTELFKVNPNVEVHYVEASARMIALAKKKANQYNVHFIQGTENDIPRLFQFDIIITNFYLDLFSNESLKTVLTKIKESLKQKGQLIVTDFLNNTWWQRLMLAVMYKFFRTTCAIESEKLPEWNKAISESGGQKKESKLYYGNFIETAIFQF